MISKVIFENPVSVGRGPFALMVRKIIVPFLFVYGDFFM